MPVPIEPGRAFSWEASAALPIEDCGEPLVPASLCPELILARPQYFFEGLQGARPEIYLRSGVWERLLKAARTLPPGHRFVILDGWRPVELQAQLFNLYKEELRPEHPELDEAALDEMTSQFVARPGRVYGPPPHSTGGAVDLTIASPDGLMLPMGTGFDETSPRSVTTWFEQKIAAGEKLSPDDQQALNNRRMLYHTMTAQGFTNYPDEWWHYDFGNQNWALLIGAPHAQYGRTRPQTRWA